MKSKHRFVFFWTAVALFLVGGAYAVLISQGIVLDVRHLTFTKTGSIFLKYVPQDATVTINGEKQNVSPGFLNTGVLIKNLIPKTYHVTLQKTEFYPWEKDFSVNSGIVSRSSHIRLWPKQYVWETLSPKNAESFFPAGNGIIIKQGGVLSYGSSTLKGETVVFYDEKSDITVTGDGQTYFAYNLQSPIGSTNLNSLFNSLKQNELGLPGTVAIKAIFPHPFSKNKVLIQTNTAFYAIDLEKIDVERLFSSKIAIQSASVTNEEILALDKNDVLIAYNLILKTQSITPLLTIPKNIPTIQADESGHFLFFLTSSSSLIAYNRNEKQAEKIGDNIISFFPSPEGKRVAVITKDNRLFIFVLENYDLDNQWKKDTRIEIPFSGDTVPSELLWIPSFENYVLLLSGNSLILQEIDFQNPLNRYEVRNDVKMFTFQKYLYVSDEEGHILKTNLNL